MPTENHINIPIITVGADPELFIRDKKTKKFISAHDILPGTKEKPYPVQLGAVQVDGVAAEFNIAPAKDYQNFTHNCQTVLEQLKTMVGEGNELVTEPFAVFDKEYWDKLPAKPKELGCNPDYNGWEAVVNSSPDDSKNPTMRTASGHIHIGWGKKFDPKDNLHFTDCCIVAKQMDYVLGIYSLLWDQDPNRRTLYGKAGCFRPKEYGIEYRTMSNKWLTDTKIINWIWKQAYLGMAELFKGNVYHEKFGDKARKIIDNNIVDWINRKEFSMLHQFTIPSCVKLPERKTQVKADPKRVYKKSLSTMDVIEQAIQLMPSINNDVEQILSGLQWQQTGT